MRILKKVIAGVMCSVMVLSMGFSVMAAEETEKAELKSSFGSLDNRIAISNEDFNRGMPTGAVPKLKSNLNSRALWEFSISGVSVYPIGEMGGQNYIFEGTNFYTDNPNFNNELAAQVTPEQIEGVVNLFNANGYRHVGWQQYTNYQIRSSLIPKQIKYWVNNFGEGIHQSIPLNSSHRNYNGSFVVTYGVGINPTAPYAGWTYGEYASMFADQVSRIEFLCAVYYN